MSTLVEKNSMPFKPCFLGFESANDFIDSFFKFSNWTINGISAVIASTTTFITGYMWDTEEAVYTLWIIMAVDWITGIMKAIKSKSYYSNKVFRMPIYYVVTSFILSISWWMSKNNVLFVPLPAIAMGGFYAVYFTSLLENLGELEFLPKKVVDLLKKFGLKVLIEKYITKN